MEPLLVVDLEQLADRIAAKLGPRVVQALESRAVCSPASRLPEPGDFAEWMTLDQVLKVLEHERPSRHTIRRWIDNGTLPPAHVRSGRKRWARDDVFSWRDQGRIGEKPRR